MPEPDPVGAKPKKSWLTPPRRWSTQIRRNCPTCGRRCPNRWGNTTWQATVLRRQRCATCVPPRSRSARCTTLQMHLCMCVYCFLWGGAGVPLPLPQRQGRKARGQAWSRAAATNCRDRATRGVALQRNHHCLRSGHKGKRRRAQGGRRGARGSPVRRGLRQGNRWGCQ